MSGKTHNWTIRSLSDPKYVVTIANADRAHAEQVRKDLIENEWTPSDLVLEREGGWRLWGKRG